MSVAELQACLARLYVDRTFRRLFERDPDIALADYQLEDAERCALLQIDRRMLDYFAGIIASKRRRKLQSLFPATLALGADEFELLFQRYHELQTAGPRWTAKQEAQEFGYFLEESLMGRPDLPPYSAEIARFERLCQEFYQSQPLSDGREDSVGEIALTERPFLFQGVQIVDFRYDVVRITRLLRHGAALKEIDPGLGEYHIAFKSPQATGLMMWRVNSATKFLLSRCDGKNDVAAIVSAMEDKIATKGLQKSIVSTLKQLRSLGFIGTVAEDQARNEFRPNAFADVGDR